jgi:hypothetical protein
MIRQILFGQAIYVAIVLIGTLGVLVLHDDAKRRVEPQIAEHLYKKQVASVAVSVSNNFQNNFNQESDQLLIVEESQKDQDSFDNGVENQSESTPQNDIENNEFQNGSNDPEGLNNEEVLEEEEIELPVASFPYEQSFFQADSEWHLGYGEYSFTDENKMTLGGGDIHSSSLVLLRIDKNYDDYKFRTIVDWHRGPSLSLIARFEDYDNYALCSFGERGSGATVAYVKNGNRKVVGSSPGLQIDSFQPWKNVDIAVRTLDDHIECFVNGESIIGYTLDSMPKEGTVGIGVWSEDPGGAFVTVKNVTID